AVEHQLVAIEGLIAGAIFGGLHPILTITPLVAMGPLLATQLAEPALLFESQSTLARLAGVIHPAAGPVLIPVGIESGGQQPVGRQSDIVGPAAAGIATIRVGKHLDAAVWPQAEVVHDVVYVVVPQRQLTAAPLLADRLLLELETERLPVEHGAI